MSHIVYVDIETGGFEWWPIDAVPMRPIIEIAAVAVDTTTGRESTPFHARVAFKEDSCHPDALALWKSHNTPESWNNALKPAEVVFNLNRWLEPFKCIKKVSKTKGTHYAVCQLAGWNIAGFDAPFLWAWFRHFKQFFPVEFYTIDVMQKAMIWDRTFNPSSRLFENYQLGTCSIWAGHDLSKAHTALADVRATLAVDREINKRFAEHINPKTGEKL